ncbi:MAG: hypothetical protein ABL308_12755 [Oceanicaulis sp.]
MSGGARREANAVRPETGGFDALIDWERLPGLHTLTDPDGAAASARRIGAEIAGRRGGKSKASADAVAASRREAAFDAALESLDAGALIDAARAKRREAMRVSSVRSDPDRAKAARRAELKAQRRAARAAEARRGGLPVTPRPGGFSWLVERDCLPVICVQAGHDIDRILTAVEAGVFAASDPDTLQTGGVKASGRRGAPQFMAIEGYLDRYVPWTRRLMAEDYVRAGLPGRAVLAVVIAVIRDGRTPRELDGAVGKRNGTCMGLLCDGLREYARLAKWTGREQGG